MVELKLPAGALPPGRVWALFGEAGARGRGWLELAIETLEADQAERQGCRLAGGGGSNRGSGRQAEAGAPAITRASAARRGAAPGHLHLRIAAARCAGSARRSPRPSITCPAASRLYGTSARSCVVPGLRHGGGGAGAGSRDRPRSCRRRPARAHHGIEVRRSSAALSPGRDLRPRGHHPGNLDAVRLGRGDGGQPSTRWSTRSRPGSWPATLRRRRAGAGAGAGHRQDQDHGDCGPMFAMSGPSPESGHQRLCSSTHPIAKASTHEPI